MGYFLKIDGYQIVKFKTKSELLKEKQARKYTTISMVEVTQDDVEEIAKTKGGLNWYHRPTNQNVFWCQFKNDQLY